MSRNLLDVGFAFLLVLGLVLAAVLLSTPLFELGGSGTGPGAGNGGGVGGGDNALRPSGGNSFVLSRCGNETIRGSSDRVRCLNNPEVDPEELRGEPMDVDELTIVFGREPIPGRRVPVLVVDSYGWVEGMEVSFNGDTVGVTDRYGVVWGRVPYTESLEVNASPYKGDIDRDMAVYKSTQGTDKLVYSGGGEPVLVSHETVSSTVYLNTEITVNFTEPPIPGNTSGIRAHIDDVPVRKGYVSINGMSIGVTDRLGRLRFRVPNGEEFRVSVRRGAASGTRVVDPDDLIHISADEPLVPESRDEVHAEIVNESLVGADVWVDGEFVGETSLDGNVSVTPSYSKNISVEVSKYGLRNNESLNVSSWIDVGVNGTPFPGQRVVVDAEMMGNPVTGAEVEVGGETVGRTDSNGSVAFEMPLRASVEVVVSKGEAQGSVVVGWPMQAYLLIAIGLLSLLYTGYRRRRGLANSLVASVRGFGSFLVEFVLEVLVMVSMYVSGFVVALPGYCRRFASGSWSAFVFILKSLPRPWLLVQKAVNGLLIFWCKLRSLIGLLRAMGLSGVFLGVHAWITGYMESDVTDSVPSEDGESGVLGVEEAWRRMVDLIGVVDVETKTAVEVADTASEQGYSEDSVRELTRLYREVRYGNRPETRERKRLASSAYNDLMED